MKDIAPSTAHMRLGGVLGRARYFMEQEFDDPRQWELAYRRIEQALEDLLRANGSDNTYGMRYWAATTYQALKEET